MAVVAVLAIVIGVLELIFGALLLIFSGDVDGWSSGEAVFFGIVTIIVGLVYLWVGRGLQKLNSVALVIGLVVSGFRTAYDLGWLLAVGIDGIGFTGLVALIVNGFVFAALWTGRKAFDRT